MQLYENHSVNGKRYKKVIRLICPKGAAAGGSEGIREFYVAEGYGLIQYTSADSTIWDIVD